jgi:hypothetical protein
VSSSKQPPLVRPTRATPSPAKLRAIGAAHERSDAAAPGPPAVAPLQSRSDGVRIGRAVIQRPGRLRADGTRVGAQVQRRIQLYVDPDLGKVLDQLARDGEVTLSTVVVEALARAGVVAAAAPKQKPRRGKLIGVDEP